MRLRQRGHDVALFNPNKKDEEYLQEIMRNNKPDILYDAKYFYGRRNGRFRIGGS